MTGYCFEFREVTKTPTLTEYPGAILGYTDVIDYALGGITFDFPDGYFTETPKVSLAVELMNEAYAPGLTVEPIVETLDSEQAVVRVNKSGAEAASDDIKVHLTAPSH